MEQHTWSSICGLFRLNVNSSNLSTSLVYFRWLFPDAPYMEYICQGLPPQNGPKDPECKSYSHHGAYTWLVNDTATHPDLQHVGSGSTRRLFWLFDSFTPQMVFLHKYCRLTMVVYHAPCGCEILLRRWLIIVFSTVSTCFNHPFGAAGFLPHAWMGEPQWINLCARPHQKCAADMFSIV
jgi:hypothetical protein